MYDELVFENCRYSKDPLIGCALEGVATVIAGIKDAAIVIHSPQGCAATVSSAFDACEVDFTNRKIGCTRLFESDVIMGASEKLKSLIKEADVSFDCKVIFVVGTCAADIIGEDLEGICIEVSPKVKSTLIPIYAGGFRGDFLTGIDEALNALIPFIRPNNKKIFSNKVNIIAPQASINPTWWADIYWVKDILYKLGLKINTILTFNTSIKDIEKVSEASANILLSHDAGYDFAKKLEKLFDIPLILSDIPLPIGLKNTKRWIKRLAQYFGVTKAAEDIIKKGEKRVVDILRRRALMIIPRYHNCKIAISADASFSIGLVRMLFEDLEMIPKLILLRSCPEYAKEILKKELNDLGLCPKVSFETDGYKLKEALKTTYIDAIIGSSWEYYIAKELGIKLAFDVFSPTNRDIYLDRAFLGYDGMLTMLEIIANDWERAIRSKDIIYKNDMESQKEFSFL